ncbi:Pentatricopeptide repeat-containing protein [Acorus calamus]|uniref:Pentatricopeptide repeat-containing protein n=1 Tax=Acorus calamus TaxID=4465 RepID=A0AAV9DXC3_ACOCL|nr:Pentatricopeptide repeat-containing protein [Acorus calamus]
MASTLPLPLTSPPQNPTPPPKTIITKPPTFRSRLSQLCKDGRPDLARRLLLDRPIPSTSTSTSTVLWNTVLIGLVCNGLPEDALRFLSLMSPASVRPDHYTFSSALKACADSNQLLLGRSIHARILRRYSRPNRILSNSLLNMYSSCGCRQVQLLFDRMRARNAVAWNTVIAWHARNARPSDAVVHFRRLLESGTAPTPVSFVNVFPAVACLDRALPDAVHALLLKFGGGFVGDPFVTSSAVAMYSELSDMDSARKVFDRTALRNTEVWNTMIGACVQNELPREALDLYLQIFESEIVSTDSVTLIAVLMAVSQLQSIDYGRQIHALVMKSAPMDSPVALSNALVVMYSRCGEVETAFRLFDEMSERDIVTWNTMVSAFVQNGFDSEGLMLVRAMQKKGFAVDPVAAMALLSAASNLGDSRIGRETHAYVFRRGSVSKGWIVT